MKLRNLVIALLFSLAASSAFGQGEHCETSEKLPPLPLADPSYSDTIVLEQDLSQAGLNVQCVLRLSNGVFGRPKLGNVSSDTWFVTDHGNFQVSFLPSPYAFDSVEVKERWDGHRYFYSFSGSPTSGMHLNGPTRVYFLKRHNKMFIVYDAQLAAALAKIPFR